MSHINDINPYFHGEGVGQQVWKDAMTDIVPRMMCEILF
jgi:hypothetical protein